MTYGSALVAVALALTGRPNSEAKPEVTVEIDPCLSVARSEVLRLTELELDARVVAPSLAPPHATRVDVTCPYAKAQFEKDPSIRDVLA